MICVGFHPNRCGQKHEGRGIIPRAPTNVPQFMPRWQEVLRATRSRTRGDLPLPGTATPATYSIGGKQYVLIATGGEGGGSQFRGATGGVYVAFTLP